MSLASGLLAADAMTASNCLVRCIGSCCLSKHLDANRAEQNIHVEEQFEVNEDLERLQAEYEQLVKRQEEWYRKSMRKGRNPWEAPTPDKQRRRKKKSTSRPTPLPTPQTLPPPTPSQEKSSGFVPDVLRMRAMEESGMYVTEESRMSAMEEFRRKEEKQYQAAATIQAHFRGKRSRHAILLSPIPMSVWTWLVELFQPKTSQEHYERLEDAVMSDGMKVDTAEIFAEAARSPEDEEAHSTVDEASEDEADEQKVYMPLLMVAQPSTATATGSAELVSPQVSLREWIDEDDAEELAMKLAMMLKASAKPQTCCSCSKRSRPTRGCFDALLQIRKSDSELAQLAEARIARMRALEQQLLQAEDSDDDDRGQQDLNSDFRMIRVNALQDQLLRYEQYFAARDLSKALKNGESEWMERRESGEMQPITLSHGRFMVRGEPHHLGDASPVSFAWKDGTVQTLDAFDGETITWTTTNARHPIIYWDRGALGATATLASDTFDATRLASLRMHSATDASYCATQVSNSATLAIEAVTHAVNGIRAYVVDAAAFGVQTWDSRARLAEMLSNGWATAGAQLRTATNVVAAATQPVVHRSQAAFMDTWLTVKEQLMNAHSRLSAVQWSAQVLMSSKVFLEMLRPRAEALWAQLVELAARIASAGPTMAQISASGKACVERLTS